MNYRPRRTQRFQWLSALALVTMLAAGLLLPNTQVAKAAEVDDEHNFIRRYADYYRNNNVPPNQTAFGAWRDHVYRKNVAGADQYKFNDDTGYYRTVCNTVAAAALVKQLDTGYGRVEWSRLRAMLVGVATEYSTNPYTSSSSARGWGYSWNGETIDLPDRPATQTQLVWTMDFVGFPCALAAALMWEDGGLTTTQKTTIRNTLRIHADRLYEWRTVDYYQIKQNLNQTAGQPEYCGNSQVESASAAAAFFAVMSQFDRDIDSNANPVIPPANRRALKWRVRAQELMEWAYTRLNPTNCSAPGNSINYANTVTNHLQYPNPTYGLSVVVDTTSALLPWLGQDIELDATSTGITGIDPLHGSSANGNQRLYGGTLTRPQEVYYSNIRFVQGATTTSTPLLPAHSPINNYNYAWGNTATGDWKWTYKSWDLSVKQDVSTKNYLGRTGVNDWGFGADFQNSAFVYPALYYKTVSATGNGWVNYQRLLAYQKSNQYWAYLPPVNSQGCIKNSQTSSNWTTHGDPLFLAAACGTNTAFQVAYFENFSMPTIEQQINTHLFLNSFKALNHVVAYIALSSWAGTAFWPKVGAASGLPNFNDTSSLMAASESSEEGIEAGQEASPNQGGAIFLPMVEVP